MQKRVRKIYRLQPHTITDRRMALGMSQEELCREARLSKMTVLRAEKEPDYTCNLETVEKLSRALGLTEGEILLKPDDVAIPRPQRRVNKSKRRGRTLNGQPRELVIELITTLIQEEPTCTPQRIAAVWEETFGEPTQAFKVYGIARTLGYTKRGSKWIKEYEAALV